MVFNIVLNSGDVSNPNNTIYTKSFINGSLTIPYNSEICVSQIIIPYSWFNISYNYNNNILSYIWNGYYPSVIWNGSMTGTIFTGALDSGSSRTFVTNQIVIGDNLPTSTIISSVEVGTVTLSNTFITTSPTTITGIPTFTGYITMTTISGVSTPILTLSSTITGTFALQTVLYSSNTSLGSNVYIQSLNSGTLGINTSKYILSSSQTVNVGSSGTPFKFGFIGTYNTITFPDGFYEASDINNYIQSYMISKNQYLYNSTMLQNQYFLNLYANTTYYANQLILQTIPQSFLQYTTANASSSYTSTSEFAYSPFGNTVQVVIVDNFSNYIGLSAATYPSSPKNTDQSIISNITPLGSTVNSVNIRSNLVSNNACSPTDLLDVFYPNAYFGSNIVYQPPHEKWVSIVAGTYSSFYIYFTDQNNNDIVARDNNVMISLLIKPGYENVQALPPTIIQTIQPIAFRD